MTKYKSEKEALEKAKHEEIVQIGMFHYQVFHGTEHDSLVEVQISYKKEYCKAKSKLNKPDKSYKDCTCHNFCKYDNIQFDTDLA